MAFGVFWLIWILWETLRLGVSGLSWTLFTESTPPPSVEGGGLANAIVRSDGLRRVLADLDSVGDAAAGRLRTVVDAVYRVHTPAQRGRRRTGQRHRQIGWPSACSG